MPIKQIKMSLTKAKLGGKTASIRLVVAVAVVVVVVVVVMVVVWGGEGEINSKTFLR